MELWNSGTVWEALITKAITISNKFAASLNQTIENDQFSIISTLDSLNWHRYIVVSLPQFLLLKL